ncbi:MAG: MerR family transcriptional regulator [Armatimonadota bacterium]|nr:MerR family transcriptional regulator [Armatimonadota bacterium]
MTPDRGPKYTIKTVAKMTGVGTATLRAWEKRYGIPAPVRTASRYRLYSDADVREIRWLVARIEQGIPPRQAARLAIDRRTAGVALDEEPSVEIPALISDLRAACLAYDEETAEEILRRAASVLRPHEIVRSVVLPAVAQVGRDWEAGLVNVAQEHFTSGLTRRVALRLMDLYQASPGLVPIVCACAPGELHELGLLAVALELRRRGHPVVNLGQATPVDAALSAIERLGARIAVVAATLPEHLEPWVAARGAVEDLHRRTGAVIVWGGPGAACASAQGLPGPAAVTIDEAVAAVAGLLEMMTPARGGARA